MEEEQGKSRNPECGTGHAETHGSPGTRTRFNGLVRMFWPFLPVVFAAGYLVRCAMPEPGMSRFAAGAALVALALFAWWMCGRAFGRFANFWKGAQGEEAAARALGLLPEGYSVFHGVPDGAGGDIDHVVVGPKAVIVVETKNWAAPVTFCEYGLQTAGIRPTRSPIQQVRDKAAFVRKLLDGDAAMPFCVICFAGDALEGGTRQSDEITLCNETSLRDVILRLNETSPALLSASSASSAKSALLTLLSSGK